MRTVEDTTEQTDQDTTKHLEDFQHKRSSKEDENVSGSPTKASTSSLASCSDSELSKKPNIDTKSEENKSSIPLSENPNDHYDKSNEYEDIYRTSSHSDLQSSVPRDIYNPNLVKYSHKRIYNSGVLIGSPVIVEAAASPEQLHSSPRRPRSRRVDTNDLDRLSVHSLTSCESFPEKATDIQESAVKYRNEIKRKPPSRPDSPFSPPESFNEKSIYCSSFSRNYEEICADLPPLELDTAEQDAMLQKVLQEIQTQSIRPNNLPIDLNQEIQTESIRQKKLSIDLSPIRNPAVVEEKTDDNCTSYNLGVNQSETQSTKSSAPSDHDNDICKNNEETCEILNPVTDHFDTEEKRTFSNSIPVVVEPSKSSPPNRNSVGNSLGSMTGWSSELESPLEDLSKAARGRFAFSKLTLSLFQEVISY